MVAVKIQTEKRNWLHTVTTYLTVALAVVTLAIIVISHDNPEVRVTGYSVFSDTYGGASPFIILGLLVVIIFLYLRIRRE